MRPARSLLLVFYSWFALLAAANLSDAAELSFCDLMLLGPKALQDAGIDEIPEELWGAPENRGEAENLGFQVSSGLDIQGGSRIRTEPNLKLERAARKLEKMRLSFRRHRKYMLQMEKHLKSLRFAVHSEIAVDPPELSRLPSPVPKKVMERRIRYHSWYSSSNLMWILPWVSFRVYIQPDFNSEAGKRHWLIDLANFLAAQSPPVHLAFDTRSPHYAHSSNARSTVQGGQGVLFLDPSILQSVMTAPEHSIFHELDHYHQDQQRRAKDPSAWPKIRIRIHNPEKQKEYFLTPGIQNGYPEHSIEEGHNYFRDAERLFSAAQLILEDDRMKGRTEFLKLAKRYVEVADLEINVSIDFGLGDSRALSEVIVALRNSLELKIAIQQSNPRLVELKVANQLSTRIEAGSPEEAQAWLTNPSLIETVLEDGTRKIRELQLRQYDLRTKIEALRVRVESGFQP